MIVVRVELHHATQPGKVTELARMTISNVGGSKTLGNYEATVLRKPKFKSMVRECQVTGHRRLTLPVWALVARALSTMGYTPSSHYHPLEKCSVCGVDIERPFEEGCASEHCPQGASTS
jgi:hypothetical protein